MENNKYVINAKESGQRIDNYLFKKLKGKSHSFVYKILRKGEVRVNGKRVKQTYKLEDNDILRLPPFCNFTQKQKLELNTKDKKVALLLQEQIIWQNSDFLVLNKPEGICVHKGTNNDLGIIELMQAGMQNSELSLVHRLDKETSGCLMIAKSRQALLDLQQKLKSQKITKIYHAIVDKGFSNSKKIIRTTAYPKMLTKLRKVKKLKTKTLLELELITGKKHQIRMQLAELGYPIIGDEKYNNSKKDKKTSRMFLHAAKLELELPPTGEKITISATYDLKWEHGIKFF